MTKIDRHWYSRTILNKLAIQSQVLVQWTIIWRQNDNFAISSRINYYLQFTLEEYIRQVESKTDSFISSTVYSSNPFPVTNLNSFRKQHHRNEDFLVIFICLRIIQYKVAYHWLGSVHREYGPYNIGHIIADDPCTNVTNPVRNM